VPGRRPRDDGDDKQLIYKENSLPDIYSNRPIPTARFLSGLLVLSFFYAPGAASGPLGLPDSARPGALRPAEVGETELPKAETGGGFEIPPVIDRPLRVDEGPRLVVQQFNLVDAQDLPAYDIQVDEVRARLDEKRLQKPDGFTIGELNEIAEIVTDYYREKGLILAQAVIPVQSVENGVVNVQVFEGRLGRVIPEGNRSYDDVVLQSPFKRLIGQPVTKAAVEHALLQLTDFPGLTVLGIFQPGQLVGTADIVLRVQEEKRFDISYRVDNHGLQDTGRERFRPELIWNNITDGADKLSITFQQTYNPKNNLFMSAEYERYIDWGVTAGFFLNDNEFDVGGELARQEISGETEMKGGWLEKTWIRSRQLNLYTRAELNHEESRTFSRDRLSNEDKLTVLSLEANLEHVDNVFKGINFATIEYSQGFEDLFNAMGSAGEAEQRPTGSRPSRQGGDRTFASAKFEKLFVSASRLQTVTPKLSLLVRGEYQWSNDLLVPMEQYSVGGPDNLRAFPQAQILLDHTLFLSAEFIHAMPFISDKQAFGNRTWGELIQLSAFFDYMTGELNNPLDSQPQGFVNLKGAGVQGRFTLPGSIEARIMWAWEVQSDEAENERRPQLWGDFTYRF
jgi:hemolysin activation/secretion protein